MDRILRSELQAVPGKIGKWHQAPRRPAPDDMSTSVDGNAFFALLKNWNASGIPQTPPLGSSRYAYQSTMEVYDEGGRMHKLTTSPENEGINLTLSVADNPPQVNFVPAANPDNAFGHSCAMLDAVGDPTTSYAITRRADNSNPAGIIPPTAVTSANWTYNGLVGANLGIWVSDVSHPLDSPGELHIATALLPTNATSAVATAFINAKNWGGPQPVTNSPSSDEVYWTGSITGETNVVIPVTTTTFVPPIAQPTLGLLGSLGNDATEYYWADTKNPTTTATTLVTPSTPPPLYPGGTAPGPLRNCN
jgi:hypothetical protein